MFEKKTEECASCTVINEIKVLSWKIWWLRTAVEKVWKMVKNEGKVGILKKKMSGKPEPAASHRSSDFISTYY